MARVTGLTKIAAVTTALLIASTAPAAGQETEPAPPIYEPGPEADLRLELDAPSDTLLVGDSADLEIEIGNDGPEDADDVFVYGYLSDALKATDLDSDCDEDGYGGFSCPIGSLGEDDTESVSVSVERTKAREVWSSFSVSSSNYDPDYEDNYAELYLEPDTSNPADLAVELDGDDDPDLGESFTYEIEVTNLGPEQARAVELRDSLPFGVDVESWDSSAGADACELIEEDPYAGTEAKPETYDSPTYVYRELKCELGSLAPDATVTVDIEVERNDPYELWNSAWVTTSSYDENYENDYAYTTTQAHESVRSDVSVELSGPQTAPLVGDRFELTYTAGNAGPAPAQDTWLGGFLPEGLEFESASSTSQGVECSSNDPDGTVSGGGGSTGGAEGGTVEPAPPPSDSGDARAPAAVPPYYGGGGFNCALGTIAAGDSVDVIVTVTRSKAREMWPTGSLWSTSVDPDYEDNYAELEIGPDTSHPADVAIDMSGPEDAAIGDEVTYELTATNNGPMSALSVELVDVLPFGLDFVEATASDPDAQCGFTDGGVYPPVASTEDAAPYYFGYRELRCSLGNIASGGSTIVTLTATRSSEYEIWNSAYVSSSSYDENLDNDYDATRLDGEPYPCGPAPLGGEGRDEIAAGDCPVAAGDGDDSVVVEAGRAVNVTAGRGRDRVVVNIPSGPQTQRRIKIATGPGRDTVIIVIAPGATGVDLLVRGGGRADTLEVRGAARRGVLRLKGGRGDDLVLGSDGAEILSGGYGADTLGGGGGDDTLHGGPGKDSCLGGPGNDTTDCS